jgi:hypothetical protein
MSTRRRTNRLSAITLARCRPRSGPGSRRIWRSGLDTPTRQIGPWTGPITVVGERLSSFTSDGILMDHTPLDAHDRAVVIGGSIGGLLAARVLAEQYRRVTVLERDSFPPVGEQRRGVPQVQHTHGLLASGRNVLERWFPGFSQTDRECRWPLWNPSSWRPFWGRVPKTLRDAFSTERQRSSTRRGRCRWATICACRKRLVEVSGSSEALYRARFGTGRSRVRIPPSRPLHAPQRPAVWAIVFPLRIATMAPSPGRRDQTSNRGVFGQRCHQPQQACFIEHDHVIETLTTSRSNESLDKWIIPIAFAVARKLSSLNHPHIEAIYGSGDARSSCKLEA